MMRRGLKIVVATSGLALAACRDLQSVLGPQGPEARSIAQLSWILIGGGGVVLVLVVVIAWLAIFGSEKLRAHLAAPRTVVVAGIVMPAITLVTVLAISIWLTHGSMRGAPRGGALQVEIVGEQWWWRVGYVRPQGIVASANEIRIPVGRPVDFVLRSADVIHSFWVPNLAGKVDMVPGRTTHLRLTADRAGTFRGQCAEFCGGPHGMMAFEVVAMAAGDFDAWLHELSAATVEPTTPPARQGGELFLAAGCGGCHTLRGTAASGRIGPDLTHVGSRRRLGAAVLAMTKENIIRFVADGQHVKPGMRMPPFRVLAHGDLAMIAEFLADAR